MRFASPRRYFKGLLRYQRKENTQVGILRSFRLHINSFHRPKRRSVAFQGVIFFKFPVQEKRQTTARIIKLPLEIPTKLLRQPGQICAWAPKYLRIWPRTTSRASPQLSGVREGYSPRLTLPVQCSRQVLSSWAASIVFVVNVHSWPFRVK